LGFNLFSEETYHSVFRLREDQTGKTLCDDLEIHFLELEKVKKLKRRPTNPLEAWMMYLNNLEGEEMEAIAMENQAIKKAMTIEEMFYKSAMERRLYELREKALLDELSMMDGAKAEGMVEAKQDDIIKFMVTRFKTDPAGVKEKVQVLTDLETLDGVLTKLFATDSVGKAIEIISDTASKALQ
jgi:predicted transposase/invertase (TIGR01784 family)